MGAYFGQKWDLWSKEKDFFVPLIKWLWPNSWEERCASEETAPGGIFAVTVGTWLVAQTRMWNGKSFYFEKDFKPLLVIPTIRTFFSCQHTKAVPPASITELTTTKQTFYFYFHFYPVYSSCVALVFCARCENISSRAANPFVIGSRN